MKLNPFEAKLFLELMLPLHWYVNQQAKVLPKIQSFSAYEDCSLEDKLMIRDYLFTHPELIIQYVQDNPNRLDAEALNIISSWKNFIYQDFFVERLLKKHSILIDDQENVYAALGITDSLNDLMDKRDLPVRVQAVLLPFQGKVIYDGFLRWYRVYFGGGIKSSLKQTYLIAKDNNAIIETLDPPVVGSQTKQIKDKTAQSSQDWAPLLNELSEKAKKLRGGNGQPAAYSPIFSLVRASIEMAQLATANEPDVDKLFKKGARLDSLLMQVEKALQRME